MITNTGKEIMAKYLIGQAPAYASYIAFGCGAKPLRSTDTHEYAIYKEKDALSFEMFRSQITSRGYVTEGGKQYVVLTADLPTEERYEITEVGIFSAGSNPAANANGSRILYAFTENENWEYHTASASLKLPKYTTALHSDLEYTISVPDAVFQTNANNLTFGSAVRNLRYEKPRFLNNTILMAGDVTDLVTSSTITNIVSTGTQVTVTTSIPHKLRVGELVTISDVVPTQYNMSGKVITSVTESTITYDSTASGTYTSGGVVTFPRLIIKSGNHIHLASNGLNLSQNAPADEIKLAFSVINKVGTSTANPAKVRIIVEFSTTDASESGEYARLEIDATNGSGTTYDFEKNRYYSVSKQLQDLKMTSSFNWANVSIVKIYTSVLNDSGLPSSDYYVSLDAVRLENLNTVNPLYGLTGYTVVKNTIGSTIVKDINTSNVAEFRFSLDVT